MIMNRDVDSEYISLCFLLWVVRRVGDRWKYQKCVYSDEYVRT